MSWFFYLQINAIGEPFLNVNCKHLKEFDEDLYRQLINYPQEVVPTFDMAVNQMFFDRFPEASLEHQIQVRPFSVDKTANMRSLNPEGNQFRRGIIYLEGCWAWMSLRSVNEDHVRLK